MAVVPGQSIGIAAYQLDGIGRHAEAVCRQLQNAGSHGACAHIDRTGQQSESPVDIGLDQRRRAPGSGHPPVAGNTATDARGGRLVPVDCSGCLLQAFFDADGSEFLPGRCSVAVLPGILQAKLQAVHIDGACQLLEVSLDGERHLRAGRTTHGTAGHVICIRGHAGNVDVLETVRTRGH